MYAGSSAIGMEGVQDYASTNNIPNHYAAIHLQSPLSSKAILWPDVIEVSELKKTGSPMLVSDNKKDLLSLLSASLSEYIQFPSSTIFLHGLGCVSAAMSKSFSIEYGLHPIPASLYVVTAQPPSTGKSSINSVFLSPILKAYKDLNGLHETERNQKQRELKKLERQLDGSKGDKYEDAETLDRIERIQRRLNEIPEWKGVVSNTTVEALEGVAKQNNGMFNMVSAEADGLNVMVGAVYGDSGAKKNVEIVLKAWGGEWFSSERVGRDGFNGSVRASIAVLAQDDTIDTMLAAGESGRGLTERFLLLSEKSMLGKRDHTIKRKFNVSLKNMYESLANNIISEDDVVLNFSADADECIQKYKQSVEPGMGEGGIYSSNMVTGFIGKADIQIRKIAAVLHCIENWQDGGQRSRTISDDSAIWAISIYIELAKTFINSADYMGYSGVNSEIEKISQVLSEFAQKNKLKITISALREKIRNVKPFRGSRDIGVKLRDELLPKIELLNYCVMVNNTIYINPRLK